MIVHPTYSKSVSYYQKYRDLLVGGTSYIESNLKRFSVNEDSTDFSNRKALTYNPNYAISDVKKLCSLIRTKLSSVVRTGGHKLYQEAVNGFDGGVDNSNRTMQAFLTDQILLELLCIGKVAVFIDMPETIRLLSPPHPYVYVYKAEDILNWTYDVTGKLIDIYLQQTIYTITDGFPAGEEKQYRRLTAKDNNVTEIIYDTSEIQLSTKTVELARIPIIILDLNHSLLSEVVNHSIALLNLESSDMLFAIKQNFPIYTEQVNPQFGEKSKDKEVGSTYGLTYPVNLERPGFINPSSDPLKINMAKEDAIRQQIKTLIDAGLADLQEATTVNTLGLAAIGEALYRLEQYINAVFHDYLGSTKLAIITYPTYWGVQTPESRKIQLDTLQSALTLVPSKTYQKGILKAIAAVMLPGDSDLSVIAGEITTAEATTSDFEIISKDIENGLVTRATASRLRGYADAEAQAAEAEYTKRLADIQAYQRPGVRGVSDPYDSMTRVMETTQRKDKTMDPDKMGVRGKGNVD